MRHGQDGDDRASSQGDRAIVDDLVTLDAGGLPVDQVVGVTVGEDVETCSKLDGVAHCNAFDELSVIRRSTIVIAGV